MAYQVDTVFVWVNEIDESGGGFRQFGIEPGPRFGSWQTMGVDGETHFALHEGQRGHGPSTGAVAFRVDDLDREITRLGGMAIHPTDGEVTDTGVSRFITFTDPDGNDVQLIARHCAS